MIPVLLTVAVVAGMLQAAAAPQADPTDKVAQARAAELSGDFRKAELLYQAVLSSHPTAELYQRLGLVRHLQNNFEGASTAFQHALRLDPKLWTSHLFLGIDNYRLNRFSDGLPHLEDADRLHPNFPETQFWLGATQLALRHYLEGLEILEGVLEKDANNADVLRLLAESYADFGTRVLDQVADKYPGSAAALEIEGKALEFEGSNSAALTAYRQAAAKDPSLPGISEAILRVQNAQNK